MSLEEFKRSCIDLKADEVVERFLIERSAYFFDYVQTGKEYEFKKDIASILNVHIRDLVIVGSGKLGFSLKPDESNVGYYPFRAFDANRDKKSDLDIAVISSYLFDSEIQNLYNHTDYSKTYWQNRNSFAKYILKGRIAIRFLPTEFKFTKAVREAQEKYRMEFGREINIEIYKSWYFFETYHRQNIKGIQINLIA